MTSRIAPPAARTRRSSRLIALVAGTAFVEVAIAWATCFVVACVAAALGAAIGGGAGLAVLIGLYTESAPLTVRRTPPRRRDAASVAHRR